jgi:hypothetical protein
MNWDGTGQRRAGRHRAMLRAHSVSPLQWRARRKGIRLVALDCREAFGASSPFTRQPGEAQVGAAQEFGEEDDLAGVIGEMLRDVGDGLESRDRKSLDEVYGGEVARAEVLEDAAGFGDGFLKPRQRPVTRKRPGLGKFLVALPPVRCSSQARDNPLPHVSRKVKHEVAHAV